MQLKKLLADDEGVSPVIGVILMVAITVILAAVIAAFVLGLGDSGTETPQASFDFDYDGSVDGNNTALTITVESGDTIDGSQLSVEGDGLDGISDTNIFGDGDVTAGSSDTINADELNTAGGTVNVVWESSSGDDSSILASFDVPDDHTDS